MAHQSIATTATPSSPPHEARQQRRTRRAPRSDVQSSFHQNSFTLLSLPENSPSLSLLLDGAPSPASSFSACASPTSLDAELKGSSSMNGHQDLLAHRLEAPPLVTAASAGVTSSLLSATQAVAHNGATYNGRRPPRRSSRFQNNHSLPPSSSSSSSLQPPASTNANNTASTNNGLRRESWKITDWEVSPLFDSTTSSFNCNASQTSLYHVLDELEDDFDASGRTFNQSCGSIPGSGVQGSSGVGGLPGLIDVSDRSSLFGSSNASLLESSQREGCAPPRRGLGVKQASYKRSVQSTLRQDEDLSSSFPNFGASGGSNNYAGDHNGNGCEEGWRRRASDDSDLEHVFGDLLIEQNGSYPADPE